MESPKCQTGGCGNVAERRGKKQGGDNKLCTTHRKRKYGMPRLGSRARRILRDGGFFEKNKCETCGWDGPCDRHRMLTGKDGGRYIKGNIAILCPNCHRLQHEARPYLI